MPADKDVYTEPPKQTPLRIFEADVTNPAILISKAFYYAIDRPVTYFHDWLEHQRSKRRIYYYHRVFDRVPDLSTCLEDDIPCQFEAEMQWQRDYKVDQEIVKIMRARFEACVNAEGPNWQQNCAKVKEDYTNVCKGFKSRYTYLGVHASARKCLMKQKARMIEERKAAAAASAEQ